MQVTWGLDAVKLQEQRVKEYVCLDTSLAVNGHALIVGMSGAGKTHTLRKVIRQMSDTAAAANEPMPRFHVFDVHGDINIPGASTVLFSEQTQWGLNPLRVNPDPHYGGVRKRVQSFSSTINRVMRNLGEKQEAVLRNLLLDVYARHGFKSDDPSTWLIDTEARLLSDGADNRFYLDVPIEEKDGAKALGARWDAAMRAWFIQPSDYRGAITKWPPKMTARTHPGLKDVIRMAQSVMEQQFLGTGITSIANLEAANRAAQSYQKKLLSLLRRGEKALEDPDLKAELDKVKKKAIDAYTEYANSIVTGREMETLFKYDSTAVLKSVIDRLENLESIGIFKTDPPPFDPRASVWRYNIKPLLLEERKLFVLFKLEELFMEALQRGEQPHILDVIVLDEAHIYMDDSDDNIIDTIAKEARKFGVSLIAAS